MPGAPPSPDHGVVHSAASSRVKKSEAPGVSRVARARTGCVSSRPGPLLTLLLTSRASPQGLRPAWFQGSLGLDQGQPLIRFPTHSTEAPDLSPQVGLSDPVSPPTRCPSDPLAPVSAPFRACAFQLTCLAPLPDASSSRKPSLTTTHSRPGSFPGSGQPPRARSLGGWTQPWL